MSIQAPILKRTVSPPAVAEDISHAAELAIVVPTYNERDNIGELLHRLSATLESVNFEVIFVDDDSPDGTADVIRQMAARDSRIRLLHRVGRRGLSSACIEGMLATSATFIAVMDADLQHDEGILPSMLHRLRHEFLDLVNATRHAEGGSMGPMSSRRQHLSHAGERVSRLICKCDLTDPMSGFFMVRRTFLEEVVRDLQGGGFKILVDMLASSRRPVRVAEVEYTFRSRLHGVSKLDARSSLELLFQVLHRLTGGYIPVRFASFAVVGAIGLLTHFLIVLLLFRHLHSSFAAAQILATICAMTENFFINNLITYRDRSLRGVRMFTGLLTFSLACTFGAVANVSFAEAILRSGFSWYIASLAGILLGSVWNYAVSSLFTWQQPQAPLGSPVVLEDTPEVQYIR